MSDKYTNVAACKAKANALMKSGKYVEAILEYTQGIELQPANPVLYSNRSLAFLKVDQHFFAMKDAETTITLVPDWAKGYYRKGQAEQAAERYDLASKSYAIGLRSCPGDEMLLRSLDEVKQLQRVCVRRKTSVLIRYTTISSLVGCLVAIGDMLQPREFPAGRRSGVRITTIIFFAFIGYLLATLVIRFRRTSKNHLLQPPPELMGDPNCGINSRTGGRSSNVVTNRSNYMYTRPKFD